MPRPCRLRGAKRAIGDENDYHKAELVRVEKENSDWFPLDLNFAIGTAKMDRTRTNFSELIAFSIHSTKLTVFFLLSKNTFAFCLENNSKFTKAT